MKAQAMAGIYIAIMILSLWLFHLDWALHLSLQSFHWWIFFPILIQTHLYTGVFITAHDAMHGSVSKNKFINNSIGKMCALVFAFNYYPLLYANHHKHHDEVASATDPDYHKGSFLSWYFSFLSHYLRWWQIILMGITFNVLILFFQKENVILFWMLPSLLSTLQLFYFGTYLPHRGEFASDNIHHSRTQKKNHWQAFFSCYFFGYHYEHHDSPETPWWLLHVKKSEMLVQ